MTAAEHAAKAEELLESVSAKKRWGSAAPDVPVIVARANTHATLAVFYATTEANR